MTIGEWNTCLPNRYSLKGTGLMAAYGLLQGWASALWPTTSVNTTAESLRSFVPSPMAGSSAS